MQIRENMVLPQEFQKLYESVGWEAPGIEQIKIALDYSLCTFGVYEEDQLIGMARLLGDYAMSYYIKDFAIHPDYQGKGVGGYLMEYIENFIKKQLQTGWAVSLELISSKGKEEFYKRFGFEERPCEWDGSGMFKMVCEAQTKDDLIVF